VIYLTIFDSFYTNVSRIPDEDVFDKEFNENCLSC